MKPYKTFKTYDGFEIFGKLLRMDFRKIFLNGQLAGYHHVAISISPHYHFNSYKHNGNDLSPKLAQKSILEILAFLEIDRSEFKFLQVVNLEFGLNIIPTSSVKLIVDGISFYKKTSFIIRAVENPLSKITKSSKQKFLKAYAKGIQCHEKLDAPEIDINTFRFEVKHKKAFAIRKHGISSADDFFNEKVYVRLAHALIQEWLQVLIINFDPKLSLYNREDSKFIGNLSNLDEWTKISTDKNRNKFHIEKNKYYKTLKKEQNLQGEIYDLLNEKILSFGIGAYLPHEIKIDGSCIKTTTKSKRKEISVNADVQIYPHTHVIKCVTAPTNIQRRCLMTNLDITMQKDQSKFIYITGLDHYRERDLQLYEGLLRTFWSEECRGKVGTDLHKTISHNIRNHYFNNKYRSNKNVSMGQLPLF